MERIIVRNCESAFWKKGTSVFRWWVVKFWCLYNMDAYVCNLWIKLKWNELLWEIVNQHFERKEQMFFDGELWSSVRISHWSKNFSFCCCATPIIITSMPMVATCRVYVEQTILFVKIVNRYFESKECFWCASSEVLRVVLWESQARKLCTS